MPPNLHCHSISCFVHLNYHKLINASCNLWELYGITIEFAIHSLAGSLSQAIFHMAFRRSARIEASPFYRHAAPLSRGIAT